MKLQRTDKVIITTLAVVVLGAIFFLSYIDTRKKKREESRLKQEWMIVYETQANHLDTVYVTDRFLDLRKNSVFIYPRNILDRDYDYPEMVYYNVKVVKHLN